MTDQNAIKTLADALGTINDRVCQSCRTKIATDILAAMDEDFRKRWTPTHQGIDSDVAVRVVHRAHVTPTSTIVIFENKNGSFGDMISTIFDKDFRFIEAEQ